jgi:hypothetical protein
MKQQRLTLIALLLVSLGLSLFYNPYYNILSGDKEIYRYIGMVMVKGGVPYRDVFDHKPPLIFFLNYAGLLLGTWGHWLIDTALALLATWSLFRLGRKYQLPCPWLPPLLFNLMLRDYIICLGMGMTREYTVMLVILFFCVLLEKPRWRFYGLGFLTGSIFFMQQDQVLGLLPFFLYAMLPGKDALPIGGRVLRVIAGFALVCLPLILYFTWNHALSVAWHDAFLFNFNWYTSTFKETFLEHLIKIRTLMHGSSYEVPFLVVMTIGIVALFSPATDKLLIALALIAVPMSISTEFMGGRDITPQIYTISFSHYILPLAATLPILLFCILAFSRDPLLSARKPVIIFGFLICANPIYLMIQHGTHLKPLARYEAPASPEMYYLKQQRPGDYQVYVFGNDDFDYVNNTLKVLAPSPWVYQHFYQLYDRWDTDHRILHSIQQDLLRHKTRYVLDFSIAPDWFRDRSIGDDWHSFLQEHYRVISDDPPLHCRLYESKDSL